MTPATVRVSKPAKRAMPWSSWTTMSPARSSANERSTPRRPTAGRAAAPRRRWKSRWSGITARRSSAAMNPSRSVACAKVRRSGGGPSSSQFAVEPREVVRGALAVAAARPRHDGAVAGAQQALERRPPPRPASARSRRRPGRAARRRPSPASECSVTRAPRAAPRASCRGRRRGRGRARRGTRRVTSAQWSRSVGAISSSATTTSSASAPTSSSSGAKRSSGSSSAMSGRSPSSATAAVLGRELGGRRDLESLERARASAA